MIVRTIDGDREIRGTSWPDRTVPPRPSLAPSVSGEAVTPNKAVGLPAFGAAIRMVAGVIAASKLDVFSGDGASKRERPDSWQAKLFDSPAQGWSAFDWLWDISASLEAFENALLQKIKGNSRILELRPVPMDYVVIYMDPRTNQKTFEINDGTKWKKYGTEDILHIRGQTISGGLVGVSKIMQHQDPIGAMLAAQRFEGAYFRNHARPDIAMVFPDTVSREQAAEWKQYWDENYGGAQNFGRAAAIGGGADLKPIPINLRDAQFIEARQLSVEDVARIMAVPGLLLEGSSQRIQGDALRAATDTFMHLHMPPRIKRIAQALKADPDLFGIGTKLYPEICIDELSFLDPLTRAQVEHQRIQDGTWLVDEVRATRGMAPLPPIPEDPSQTPGSVPQITPVGGAPNPEPNDNGDSETQENELPIVAELRAEIRELRAAMAARSDQPHITVHNHPGEPAQVTVTPTIQAQMTLLDERDNTPVVNVAVPEQAVPDVHVHVPEERAIEVSAPVVNVTNVVEPTPVTVENNITVEDEPTNAEVQFARDPQGRIKSATIQEN